MSLQLIPRPVSLKEHDGAFALDRDVVITSDEAGISSAELVRDLLATAARREPRVNPSWAREDQPVIDLRVDPQLAHLGKEGYRLEVTPNQVSLRAPEQAGLFYAVQTLRQMIPQQNAAFIPGAEIEDFPRFGWRGSMLDCCRHFWHLGDVYRYIDLLARHKFNRFHWHLTNDQGWRIEIKRYPLLTEVGAWRRETLVGRYKDDSEFPPYDGVPHGGFYTQEQIRKVVEYAAQRHITIVPEIEMPGHAGAAIAAYPELGNLSTPVEVSRTWGVHWNVFNAEEHTLRFLQDVLDETMDLFPGEVIHVGGDECPKKQWKESPAAQARIQELGLKDEDELQSYIIRRMDAFLQSRGRRLLGWDEILEGGLAPGAIVMSWRGEEGGKAAIRLGHDVVMAPNTYTYYDYMQSQDTAKEPLGIGGFISLEKAYSYEPLMADIPADQHHHVLGAQAQLWGEYISARDHLEYMAWPRLCALSEITWSPREGKDYQDFLRRLRESHLARLDAMGVKYRPLD